MNRTFRAILGALFIGVIMISAISITQNVGSGLRADLTERDLYTLSDGTKQILARLNQPITLKLVYAKTAALKGPDQIKFFNTYYSYVKALLEQYERAGGGQVVLEVVDPRPFSDEEEMALRHGLRAIPITEEENFFFGLVLQTQWGVTKTVEFFSPERQRFVEYDISYLIDTAITREKDRIGVISSLAVVGDDTSGYMAQMMRAQGREPQQPWSVVADLRQKYEVTEVEPEIEAVPEDIDVLLVVHPKDLPEQTLWAIDQYVLKGGRTVVFVDPHAVVDRPNPQAQMMGQMPSSSSRLDKLFAAWGLEMPEGRIVADRELTMSAALRPNQRPEAITGFLGLGRGAFNPDEVITGELNNVRVLFAGGLKVADERPAETELTYTPLMHTTEEGNLLAVEPFELAMMDTSGLAERFVPGDEPVTMGYLVQGRFRSAFPEGIVIEEAAGDAAEGEEAAPTTRELTGLTASESSDCAVAVFSDVDFISDLLAYQRSFFGLSRVGDNGALVLNTVEALGGSSELISVRSRGSYGRPFVVFDEIEARAEKETAARVDELKAQIRGFEQELSQLRAPSSEEEAGLLQSTVLEKIRQVELAKRQTEAELREVNSRRRGDIDRLENRLRAMNLLLAPGVILLLAIGLAVRRGIRRRLWVRQVRQAA